MKRFRFANSHFVMIGLILFGIVALTVRYVQTQHMITLAALLAMVIVVGLLIYQRDTFEIKEIEQIQYINQQANGTLTSLLEMMPVGVIKVNPQTQEVDWFNAYAELLFTTEEGGFDTEKMQEILRVSLDKSNRYAFLGDKRYAVYEDLEKGIYYFFDASSEYQAAHDLMGSRPVVGAISVDNYDDFENSISDSELSIVNSFVANFVADFTKTYSIFYRRVGTDRFYFFTDFKVLDSLMADEFAFINEFRKQAKAYELPLTLSIGIAYGPSQHAEIGQVALENLNMAEVRGGDQVVVSSTDTRQKPRYFGGGSSSSVKRTRTRTRAMMAAIADRLKSVDAVYIVGHRNLDMDALGAAVGMQFFASQLLDEAYALYDDEQMADDIARAVVQLHADGMKQLISLREAMTHKISRNSLLIMVDHSKLSLTLSREFFQQFSQTLIVDHHRRDTDYPDNAVLSYIESGASSASELVTELIQFQNAGKSKLSRTQASILMAGIMLDTKNFTTRVTSRTFDVASFLRSCGSDSLAIQTISATDFDDYKLTNEIILSGRRLGETVILASVDNGKAYHHVVTSKAADTLLTMSGIEASFVVALSEQGFVSVSARSRSQINVQRLMEALGGGGHFNLAAAQVHDASVEEVTCQLETLIFQAQQMNQENKKE